jgi:hypothetical protein
MLKVKRLMKEVKVCAGGEPNLLNKKVEWQGRKSSMAVMPRKSENKNIQKLIIFKC